MRGCFVTHDPQQDLVFTEQCPPTLGCEVDAILAVLIGRAARVTTTASRGELDDDQGRRLPPDRDGAADFVSAALYARAGWIG